MLIVCSIVLLIIIFILFVYISAKLENSYNIGSISSVIFILGGFFGVWLCILMNQFNNKSLHTDTDCKKILIEVNSINNITQDTVVVF